MNDDQRQQIRDNARYLQEVRPIDPEEIHEYVDGQPHPAVVRQVLREEALDIGLVERQDGSFEPAPTGQLAVEFDGVDALPERWTRRLEDLLVEAFGPGWPDGETGDRLRSTIREFKADYLAGDAVEYDRTTALGYAIYHLSAYYAAAQYVLADLADEGLVPSRLRVLDVGAGVGGPALGLLDLFDDALVDYHAVEPSAAADVLEDLLAETDANVHTTVHRETAESFEPGGEFDLILFANVLSELEDPTDVLTRYLDVLATDGTVVSLAPADRNTATELREVERAVEGDAGATVYAPEIRLWPDETPTSESWSFTTHDDLSVPPVQRRLDKGERGAREVDGIGTDAAGASAGDAGSTGQGASEGQGSTPDGSRQPGDGEFVNVDVQYAYSLVRTDGKRRIEYVPDGSRVAKMADMERHVTERIDCVGIKLSHDLSEGGNPLFLVGDGSQAIDHFAVRTGETRLNEDLLGADYGDLLRFENALVLWNDDEGAYNLVVGEETIVDRLPV